MTYFSCAPKLDYLRHINVKYQIFECYRKGNIAKYVDSGMRKKDIMGKLAIQVSTV